MTAAPPPGAPKHVEYALTDLGKTLQTPLTAICEWATHHNQNLIEPST
ncbi:winged helix-turn-helix transcriptional regulator [Actinophytocola sp.]